jgi:sugar-phosphatase
MTVPPPRLFTISAAGSRRGRRNWSAQIGGVLFDLDGTLVDSTAAIERQWRTFLRWYGLPDDALPKPLHGKRAEDHVRALLPTLLVAEGIARFAALEATDLDGVIAVPGSCALLEQLRDAQVPWAIVTSGTQPVVRARLAAAGLPRPPVLISAEDVTAGKPDPQPYRLGARRLQVAGPLLAIEDAPTGIASARAAGFKIVAISTTHDEADLANADLVLPDLRPLAIDRVAHRAAPAPQQSQARSRHPAICMADCS